MSLSIAGSIFPKGEDRYVSVAVKMLSAVGEKKTQRRVPVHRLIDTGFIIDIRLIGLIC